MGDLAKQMVDEGRKKAKKERGDACCMPMSSDEKPSITITCSINGYTLNWWKPGVGSGSAVAESIDEAMEGAKAYLTAGEEPSKSKSKSDSED